MIGGLFVVVACWAQQARTALPQSHHDHIPLAAVPTSIADVLVPDVASASRVVVQSMWFVNTNLTTIVTVTVTCKTTGTVLVKAAIPGAHSRGKQYSGSAAGGPDIPAKAGCAGWRTSRA